MINETSQFFAILTNVGAAKQANADALGIPWKISEMGVGDANGTDPIPSPSQTTLINERRRRPLNQLFIDPANPAVLVAEQVIPEDVGGFWIREIGLYDADGDLVAVANCAPSYKPLLPQGSGRTQVVRVNFIVGSTGNITLKLDPSVVLATREFVDRRIVEELAKFDTKQSVRVATTAPVVLSGLLLIDGIQLVAGDRVLVKNQANGIQNGVYVASLNTWARASDADASIEVTPGMLIPVEQGTAGGDSIWQLVTDAPIVLGTTPLTFEVASGPTGIVAGSYRSVTVDKRGRVVGGTNPTTLSGYGITDAMGCTITATTEAGDVSWNALVTGGLHPKLMLGSNPDGPGGTGYFYCRTYVRIPVNGLGSGAVQQFAEPYATPTEGGQMYWRGLNGSVWTPWVKVLDSNSAASQQDAEGGTSADRWMSSVRVFQSMAKFGLGATTLPTLSTVADSTTPTGLYQVPATATGLPIAEAGFIDIRRGGDGLVSQRFFSRQTQSAFFRRGNGSLGNWEEFLHSGNGASQQEAEGGVLTSRWMSPLRVFQAIAKKMAQATEAVLGVAKIATQVQTNDGVDDSTIVTPKKLRGGVSINLATNGHIAMPWWLGNFIIQWGRVAAATADREYDVTFSIAFPTSVFVLVPGVGYTGPRTDDNVIAQATEPTLQGVKLNRQDSVTAVSRPTVFLTYIALGY